MLITLYYYCLYTAYYILQVQNKISSVFLVTIVKDAFFTRLHS